MITFFVPGTPVPKGSAKAFINRRTNRVQVMQDNRDKQKPWASLIAVMAMERGVVVMDGPVAISLTFHMPRIKSHFGGGKKSALLKPSAPGLHTVKPDLDKLIRCVKDALTGVAWIDDSQVCTVSAEKIYHHRPGVSIALNYLKEEKSC